MTGETDAAVAEIKCSSATDCHFPEPFARATAVMRRTLDAPRVSVLAPAEETRRRGTLYIFLI
jgi:hypothetical protein